MKILIINFSLFLTIIMTSMNGSIIYGQEIELTIVGNSQSVPHEMNMSQLKSVLRGEQMRWNDGSKVIIALMKTTTPIGSTTSDKIFNMSGNQVSKYFLALVFQGKMKAPTFFDSVDELENFVSKTPGAIGVLQVTDDDELITISVDGKTQI